MKRNNFILKKLLLLNVKSIEEGLLQLLRYSTINIHKKCFAMLHFLPTVDEHDVIENIDCNEPVRIMESAIDFCKENTVDSVSCKVFVNNIDFKVKQNELWDFMEHFGKVLNVFISKDKKTRRSRGFAFVVFSSPYEAQRAMKAKKYELKLNGRVMNVLPAVKKKKNSKNAPNVTEKAKINIRDAAEYYIEDAKKNEMTAYEKVKDSEEVDDCLINSLLCDDSLLVIFSYMDIRSRIKLESVCKRWYTLAISSWNQVSHLSFRNLFNLNNFNASLTDRILISVLNKNCFNLKSIDLSTSPYLITQNGLSKIASTCQNLEEINLSHVLLKKDSAKILGRKLNKLRTIIMMNCLNIGEKGYWWLFKDQVQLEVLVITDTTRLIGNCIYMLPSTLTTVNFENCSELNDVGIKHLASRCPKLQNLDLSYCGKITDSGIEQLLSVCTDIVTLKLKGMGRNISTSGFLYVTGLKKLTDLDISRNIAVTDEVLKDIAIACSNLEKLNMEACHGEISNSGLTNLCRCQNLVHLNLSYVVHITDEGICELAMEGRLRTLIIRASPEISDQCAAKCVQYLIDLEQFDLSGCFYITDDLAKYIEDLHSQSTLQVIVGGTQITEEGKEKLQQLLPQSKITMKNFHVGMLRNDHDSTLVRNFFPDSSDEDDDVEDEEEIEPVTFKPDNEFHIKDEYPTVDEDGERLWVVMTPDTQKEVPSEQRQFEVETPIEKNPNASDDVTYDVEENWDDELADGAVWNIPCESLDAYSAMNNEDYDDFLENDDLSRLELIG